MEQDFELPVTYNGKELMFPAQLHLYGYTQKIDVFVNGLSVMYERDDERQWRAIVDPVDAEKSQSIKVELLQVIADSIEDILI
jgi:hypothetical protein